MSPGVGRTAQGTQGHLERGWFRVLMSPALSRVIPPDVREQQGEVLHADGGVGAAGAGGQGRVRAGAP